MDTDYFKKLGIYEDIKYLENSISEIDQNNSLNIAVASKPLGKRKEVLDFIEDIIDRDVKRITLSSMLEEEIEFNDNKIFIVDNCHYMYKYCIDGFNVINSFLDRVVQSDNVFITSWNFYSWEFLKKTLYIGDIFQKHIQLPSLNQQQIMDFILYRYNEPKYIETKEDKSKILDKRFYTLEISEKRRIDIQIPVINTGFFNRKKEKIEIREKIFDRLTYLSDGNPGIAEVLWEDNVKNNKISTEGFIDYDDNTDLKYLECFVLKLVLFYEKIKKEKIEEILENKKIDKIIRNLSNHGLININEYISLNPIYIKSILKHLEKKRLLW